MPTTSIFNTQRHQLMVMEVMKSPLTCFYPQNNSYSTYFFFVNDGEFDYGEMMFDDLEVFTDKVHVPATYLEHQNQGLI